MEATRDRLTATYGQYEQYPLRVWDDGFGPLWLYVEACGAWMLPKGVVRAMSWEDAYECCQDEIMDDADPLDPDSYARSYDESAEEGELAEGVCYRNNGEPSHPNLSSCLARYEPGGENLIRVTREVLDAYNVRIKFLES